jgi:hypothetical protein
MRQPGAETEGLRLRSAPAKFNGFCEKKLKRCASPASGRGRTLLFGGKEL